MSSPKKFVIQMSGAPGSGKSTISTMLARYIDGIVINHDLIRSFFLENDNIFSQSAKLAYSLQWTLAEDMVKQGKSVIIDSPCNYQEILDNGTALAQKYGYEYRYIRCKVDDIDVLDQRLQKRIPMRCQRTGIQRPSPDIHHKEDPAALFKKWMEYPIRPAEDIIVVDSTLGPDECLKQILEEFKLQNDVPSNIQDETGASALF
jgi:predicted kinase